MLDAKSIADIFDEWEKTLSPAQKEVCRRAIRNTIMRLKNVGEPGAKELLMSVLLFCDEQAAPK